MKQAYTVYHEHKRPKVISSFSSELATLALIQYVSNLDNQVTSIEVTNTDHVIEAEEFRSFEKQIIVELEYKNQRKRSYLDAQERNLLRDEELLRSIQARQ